MQTRWLATSFDTLTRTGEIPAQSHVWFGVFFSEILKSGRTPKCWKWTWQVTVKNDINYFLFILTYTVWCLGQEIPTKLRFGSASKAWQPLPYKNKKLNVDLLSWSVHWLCRVWSFSQARKHWTALNAFAAGVRDTCTLKSCLELLFSCHFATP